MSRFICAFVLGIWFTLGWAQADYPTRSVTLIVPFPPGGGTDIGARIIANQLTQRWGQQVIVENKGGAAGQIGADTVAKSAPDGYTLLMGNIGTQSINPSLYQNLPYDADKAFAPVAMVAELPLVMMINPSVKAQTVKEFVALAKKDSSMSYSSSGSGSAPHLAAEMFAAATGISILHVPYRGGGPAVADLLAGHVQLSFMTVFEASSHIKAGKLRALAVTSDQRVQALPDVPTMSEAYLPGFNSISWLGLLAPAGTPSEVVQKVANDVQALMSLDDVKARFVDLGAVPTGLGSMQFSTLIETDRVRYEKIIRDRKISAN